ncbi:MAG: YdcF family protein, partial [Acidimicrobiales bacterium]
MALVIGILVVIIVAASVLFFIEPSTNAPARSDAVVVLAGGNNSNRIDKGIELVKAGYAPRLYVSAPGLTDCPKSLPSVPITCFNPAPATTQGEAEYVGRLARQYHWHSIAVVTTTPQDSRARLRFERCFAGPV